MYFFFVILVQLQQIILLYILLKRIAPNYDFESERKSYTCVAIGRKTPMKQRRKIDWVIILMYFFGINNSS